MLPALAKSVSDRCMQTFHYDRLYIPLTGHLDTSLHLARSRGKIVVEVIACSTHNKGERNLKSKANSINEN